MCEICEVQRDTGLSDENAKRIIDAVQANANDHYVHTILSILYTLDTPNLKIKREAAERAAEDMDYRGVQLGEDMALDFSEVTLSVRRPEDAPAPVTDGDNTLRPLKEGEISSQNDLAQLFKALGLDF